MNRRVAAFVGIGVLVAFTAGVALAQQPPGASQFQAFREKHKYTFQLMQMVRHIGEINKDKKYTLTPDQAKKVLAVLKPLRSKPKLTQDEAKKALKDLKPIFTAAQLNAMARIKPKFEQRRSPSGPPQRPNGQEPRRPPQNSERRGPDLNAMKDFNPFYSKAPKGDERAAERVKRMNEFFAELEKKASAKKTK
ncbi:MAG: hypothetical protein QME62_01955 [Armatimonadota bacterium]|nr:hypothetical protein [Armatimonadota bacterium]